MEQKTLLWLDDYRNPFDTETNWLVFSPFPLSETYVTWVKNYYTFIDYIETEGVPDGVCLDHDLGDDSDGYTGMDCAKFLVNYCLDNNIPIPEARSQSANPVGRENMLTYIEQARQQQKQDADE